MRKNGASQKRKGRADGGPDFERNRVHGVDYVIEGVCKVSNRLFYSV